MKVYTLKKSTMKGKRLMVIDDNGKKIHFGSDVGNTFIDHKDSKKKKAWIARHFSVNGDKFDDLNRPISWSANL